MSKVQQLAKGSLILQEKPFAYIVKSKFIKERCDFCLSSGKLLKCGGCQFSHYCGVLCQRDAWAEHKYECLCMKKIAPRTLPDAARMMGKNSLLVSYEMCDLLSMCSQNHLEASIRRLLAKVLLLSQWIQKVQ